MRPRGASGAGLVTWQERMRLEQVGGKFYRQAEMLRRGINVPPFFCLTGKFYQDVLAPIRESVASTLAGIDFQAESTLGWQLEAASQQIRARFSKRDFTAEQVSSLQRMVREVLPGGGFVSVRASTIGFKAEESEDSETNPFAGMSESFLYVPQEQILAKTLLCMASGFSAESILYRQRQGMDPMGFSVAVGVQRMIRAQRSFVLFTCDPNTAARETVIIAGFGAGEGVVQEKTPVDHYFVNRMSGAVRSELAVKDRMLTLAPEGGGLAAAQVPEELRKIACLSEAEIQHLSDLGGDIEKTFRAPQDIEGCYAEDGTVHILQSRPIAMDTQRQRVWTNANVTESFPGVTTPLTYTLSRYFYSVIFYDCYRLLGIRQDALRAQSEALDRMIGFLGGRVYYCLTSFYRLHRQSPLFPVFQAHWEKMMGFLSSYELREQNLLQRAAHRAGAMLRLAKAVLVILWRFATHERDIRAFHRWWEGLIRERRGRSYEGTDPLLCTSDFHEVWRQVGSRWGLTLMNDTYLPVLYGWVEALFQRWRLRETAEGPSLLSGLLCGDEDLVSVEIIMSAVRLAEQVRATPELRARFSAQAPEELWRQMEQGNLDAPFSAAVREHLHLFGDRGFQELKIEQPNLRHTPWVLLRMVQAYAREELTVEAYRQRELAVRERAERALAAALAGHPLRRFLLGALLGKLRKLIRNRENSRYCRSELFSYCKSIYAGIGGYLVREGRLRSLSDIYFLTHEEIFGCVDGTGVTANVQALADLRRAETTAREGRETPMQITTLGAVRQEHLYELPADAAAGGGILRGLGSSAGMARGIARVVLDPNQPVALGSNGILIARETDPGWLFLMLSAKAIVVERGSMLSHTAITGRKFGIPTVVAVPQATARIPDGAWIEVDGTTGIVTLLEEQRAAGHAG